MTLSKSLSKISQLVGMPEMDFSNGLVEVERPPLSPRMWVPFSGMGPRLYEKERVNWQACMALFIALYP